MVSDRPYRDGMPLEQAIEEVRRGSGSQFDPMAVEAMLTLDENLLVELLRLDHADRRVTAMPQLRIVNE